ncbi:hypothetical protein H4582DRAFT_1939030 [Lactarius indigo]|nr:hypothetical protein H4582DRAFT_2047021 [Lactarius indigo]KAI9440731.1 hypothetical protein H4582DRAFT_1939030 [Lactarius indigo]
MRKKELPRLLTVLAFSFCSTAVSCLQSFIPPRGSRETGNPTFGSHSSLLLKQPAPLKDASIFGEFWPLVEIHPSVREIYKTSIWLSLRSFNIPQPVTPDLTIWSVNVSTLSDICLCTGNVTV